jgi:hypothetical protein
MITITQLIEKRNALSAENMLTFEQEIKLFKELTLILSQETIEEQLKCINYYVGSLLSKASPEFYHALFEYYYENENPHHFNIQEEVMQDIIYRKKASWTRHNIIANFLEQYPNINVKKAALLTELVAFYDHKNMNLSNHTTQEKMKMYQNFFIELLNQWQKNDHEQKIFNCHLSYYLIDSLGMNRQQKRLHNELFHYIKPYSNGLEIHYPTLMEQYKKTSILKFLLDVGYDKIYQKEPQLAYDKILFFIENNFIEQAQLFIQYFGLDVPTLNKANSLMLEKKRHYYSDMAEKKMGLFQASLEGGYLNHKMEDLNCDKRKIKLKI